MTRTKLVAMSVVVLSVILGAEMASRARTRDCPDLSSCTIYPSFSVVANDSYVNHDLLVGPSNQTFISGDEISTPALYASFKAFKIDHPLDPANKYLLHSSVESADMKNMYDGLVTLREGGTAWVELPSWFQSLNTDFRYQLTAIGAPAAGLYVADEVSNNRFRIAGGVPGLKVSWQVTGNRHDPSALRLKQPVEQDKPTAERGRYLDPAAYGQPQSSGVRSQPHKR